MIEASFCFKKVTAAAGFVEDEFGVKNESEDQKAPLRLWLKNYKKYRRKTKPQVHTAGGKNANYKTVHHPLLRTCRQIYQEALQLYYAENSFFLPRAVLQQPRDIHQSTLTHLLRRLAKRHKVTFTSIIFEHLTYGGDLALIHLQQLPQGGLAVNWKFNPGYKPPVLPEALRLDDGKWGPVCPHSLALKGLGVRTVLEIFEAYLWGRRAPRRRGKNVVVCEECGCGKVFD